MQEKQVTIGDTSYNLDNPFLVLATQNPIDQEGTYPLPEAQRDRFMMKINVNYPTKEEELEIMKRMSNLNFNDKINRVLTKKDILKIRDHINKVSISDSHTEIDLVAISAILDDFGDLVSFPPNFRAERRIGGQNGCDIRKVQKKCNKI